MPLSLFANPEKDMTLCNEYIANGITTPSVVASVIKNAHRKGATQCLNMMTELLQAKVMEAYNAPCRCSNPAPIKENKTLNCMPNGIGGFICD